jgi:hypothetical protein
MNYVITALIAISSLLGGYIVHEQSTPNVGASQSISSLTELTSLSHNDVLPITEANGLTTKKVKWGTATSSMKAVFDPLYSPIFSTSAGLAGLLSDETGSSGGFVRAGSPSLTTPTMTSPVITLGSDATGDVYYRNAGVFTRLGIGTSGQLLTASSTGLPEWRDFSATFDSLTVTGTSTLATTTINGRIATANFGGDGSDGALSISSGTTTLDINSAAVLVKNYTSISITGTGALAFSNPATNGSVIVLKSKGSCTITTSTTTAIYLSGLGAPGGSGGTGGNGGDGNTGASSPEIIDSSAHGGVGGAVGGGAGGTQITQAQILYARSATNVSASKSLMIVPGAGGGGGEAGLNDGGGAGGDGGAGGRGSGSLYLECAGGYNVSGTIYARGNDGSLGVSTNADGGSGGGGAGGMFLAVYGYLISDTGTYTVSGGSGGSVGSGGSGTAGDGGGGGGTTEASGTAGSAAAGAGGAGYVQ